jgi:pimeloyl-ACP methyl ester carboxylesterase
MRYLLIHGGFHGAWCWQKLIPELEKLGHDAVAIDLPGHGERREEPSNLVNRAEAIASAVQAGDVLVGHSGGGFDISLAANLIPDKIGRLIYLAAGVPIEGAPLVAATAGAAAGDQVKRLNETISPAALRTNERGRLEWIDFEAARQLFYHDCSKSEAAAAFGQLSAAPPEILIEPVLIPAFWKAELPRSYIVCLQDRALPFATAMAFAGRLGVVPHFIDSSHSPFLSQPADLAWTLVAAATDQPVSPLRPY